MTASDEAATIQSGSIFKQLATWATWLTRRMRTDETFLLDNVQLFEEGMVSAESPVRTAVLLSPGLAYRDVTTQDAAGGIGNRPLLIVSAEQDGTFTRTTPTAHACSPPTTTLPHAYSTGLTKT